MRIARVIVVSSLIGVKLINPLIPLSVTGCPPELSWQAATNHFSQVLEPLRGVSSHLDCDRTRSRHQLIACCLSLLSFASVLPIGAQTLTPNSLISSEQPRKSIPLDQLGVEAQKQYSGDGIDVTPTVDGARLRAVFQKLEGQATPEGMWLESTAEENDQPERFRLLAIAQGRTAAPSSATLLDRTGKVQVTRDAALFMRPGLLEEYSVSMDGVRQDFVVLERPVGAGTLNVTLEVTGARVAVAPYGAKLTLQGSGREIAYSRLHVTDAKGRVLSAHFEVAGANLLQVRVDDAEAVYPVRIDPTFSDADWFSMGGIRGVGGEVHAIATDTAGNVYIGGSFSALGNAKINGIAKWDGSAWSPLASGVNGQVNALLVSGTDLYAGGNFTTAGGVMVNRIAKWNGSTWSALGSGMDSSVAALAISGTDLYAGGSFSMAGGATVNHIAKWNGTTWDALGTGLNNDVAALAVSGSSLSMRVASLLRRAQSAPTISPSGTAAFGVPWV